MAIGELLPGGFTTEVGGEAFYGDPLVEGDFFFGVDSVAIREA
jgi:hypothetical protein